MCGMHFVYWQWRAGASATVAGQLECQHTRQWRAGRLALAGRRKGKKYPDYPVNPVLFTYADYDGFMRNHLCRHAWMTIITFLPVTFISTP